jgi:hypothetical protein
MEVEKGNDNVGMKATTERFKLCALRFMHKKAVGRC